MVSILPLLGKLILLILVLKCLLVKLLIRVSLFRGDVVWQKIVGT